MEPKSVLTLDLSTKCCGWAVWSVDGALLDYGKLTPPSQDLPRRIYYLSDALYTIAEKHEVGMVYFEDVYVRFPLTYGALCRLQGGVMVLLMRLGCYCQFVQPSTVYSIIGKCPPRKEKKAATLKYVNARYGLRLTGSDDDVADAILIGAFIFDS